MSIAIIGAGYVGLVTGTCFAETGNQVFCMDVDEDKIQLLKKGRVPIFEPGLSEMISRNLKDGRLSFTTNLEKVVKNARMIFVAVGTPSGADGYRDISSVIRVCEAVTSSMNEYKILVLKRTVPVGTSEIIEGKLNRQTDVPFDLVSNPEFLKEGAALEAFMKPDRVVIGSHSLAAAEEVGGLYAPFVMRGAPVLVMDPRSAEMVKYASNAMLACRISFINEIANLCEHVGADIQWVRKGLGTDRRIGSDFLYPGIGYGGSCFPKDVRGLVQLGRKFGYTPHLISKVDEINQTQSKRFVEKILKFFSSGIAQDLERALKQGKKIPKNFSEVSDLWQLEPVKEMELALQNKNVAVWGLAFKPRTDDMREAPSTRIIPKLIELGAKVTVYDPEALDEARKVFGNTVEYARSSYEALQGADVVILLTEWNLFRHPKLDKMREVMRLPVIFDGRNQYVRTDLIEKGLVYFGIGQ